jgi:hypothetical protein
VKPYGQEAVEPLFSRAGRIATLSSIAGTLSGSELGTVGA